MTTKIKTTSLVLFILMALGSVHGQATLHIFSTKTQLGRGVSSYELFLNGKFATNIMAEEILEYRLVSKGRFAVTVKLSQDTKFDGVVNIEKDGDYYVVADLRTKTLKVLTVDKAEWDKYVAKVKTVPSKLEEDVKNPFGKVE